MRKCPLEVRRSLAWLVSWTETDGRDLDAVGSGREPIWTIGMREIGS